MKDNRVINMNEKIRKKLDEKKQEIKNKHKDLAIGVPEAPPEKWEKNPTVPDFVQGGPKMSKKWKQV